ncbi:mast cell protease 1A-like [Hippocampus zosterae]|uniref:mast cell protease 1A-like n=1 Tax=Hippocampus zosterae TaxID=109293 RepID=UPI00223D2FDA|nr:mast cell protease 1A-like [Hippocampus zosterae]
MGGWGWGVHDLGGLSLEMSLMSQCSTCTAIVMNVYCIIFVLRLFSWFSAATGSSIVGGEVSLPHSRPYMASLHSHGAYVCGGVLIRKDFVLTAAHCFNESMTVILGAHNIRKREKSQQRIDVDKFHPHPNYTQHDGNDVMLLKLQPNAKLNKYVQLIEVPKGKTTLQTNTKCIVAGWGQTVGGKKQPGTTSDVLKETTEKTQFPFECKNVWQYYFHSDRMMCTRPEKKGGVCWGDSGGPIICNDELQGITSFVYRDDCSYRKYPHVFTKIHPFLTWIKKVMRRNVAA